MNIKRLVFGEPCPDMDDPKMSEQRKALNSYGERFGKFVRLDKLSCWLQQQWQLNPKRFMAVFMGLISIMFVWNVYRLIYVTANYSSFQGSAVKKVEQDMQRRHLIHENK